MVFANLNIFPGYNDKQYAETVNKLFRFFKRYSFAYVLLFHRLRLHLADVIWSSEVTVVLGQNFRGLIAANEIVKVNY